MCRSKSCPSCSFYLPDFAVSNPENLPRYGEYLEYLIFEKILKDRVDENSIQSKTGDYSV